MCEEHGVCFQKWGFIDAFPSCFMTNWDQGFGFYNLGDSTFLLMYVYEGI